MPKSTPMQITLYDPETQEVKKTLSQMFVPWKLLKVAIDISHRLEKVDADTIAAEDADALAGLVVEVFGNRFSIEDLNNGADTGEMLAVLNAIMTKATGSMIVNPTLPGK